MTFPFVLMSASMLAWLTPALNTYVMPAVPDEGTLPRPVASPPTPYLMGRYVHRPRPPGSAAKRRWKQRRRAGGGRS